MTEREKILVLDDNSRWLERINSILSRDYDLISTTSYKEAIRKISSQRYALAVLDIKLPDGMTGIDVLVKMRKRVLNLKAILLTAYDESSVAVAGMRAGAVDYISKKDSDLAAKLRASIRQHKQSEIVNVFLSYDRKDLKPVSSLYRKLTVQGFVPWLDRKNIIGGRWKPQILKSIRHADFFVPCLSKNSVSNSGFIREELEFALRLERELGDKAPVILPVRIEECDIPAVLKDFQVVSLYKGQTEFQRLVRMLMQKVNQ